MLYMIKKVLNGDHYELYKIYKCDKCGEYMEEAWPMTNVGDNKNYCGDCSYITGLITEEEYKKNFLYFLPKEIRIGINPLTLEIEKTSGKFSWEWTPQDYRRSKEYKDWRKAVFERDGYQCLDCGQVGGQLEAHHIKTFNKHPKLRFVLSNGITLCRTCHMNKHRKKQDE